jgi:hypothetical protein
MAPIHVAASFGSRPNSSVVTRRPESTPEIVPTARPAIVTIATSRKTIAITQDGCAPSAMRMPISWRRRETASDITP